MWLSLMTVWPRSRNVRCSASPMPVERMWPTCIGLAAFGELKSMTTVFGAATLSKNKWSAGRRRVERLREDGIFQPEIQEACAGDFHFFADVGHVQLGERVGGELARIQFPHLGERHQRVALVVAKFWIARTNKHDGNIRIRQNFADGGLQLQLNLFVR